MRREEGFGGDEEVGGERAASAIDRRHQPDAAMPADERGRARQIDDVIDVVAVARTRLVADAGERPVEAVAEPVEREGDGEQVRRPRA